MTKLVHNVQKKQHRERSQVQSRKKYGLLEKKKDYKLRASDYHKKQAQLSILKSKAKGYNEDEYYHAMTKKKTDNRGILISDRTENLGVDEAFLLKTQDLNYLTTISQKESKKIEKDFKNSSYFKSDGSHTVFVDNKQELDDFDPVEYFKTDERLINKRENRLKVDQLVKEVDSHNKIDDDSKILRMAEKLKALEDLKKRIEREKKLQNVTGKLKLQKDLMKNGPRKKIITKEGKSVFKWKNQRKK